MEVLSHFVLQDGCPLEAAGRRKPVGHKHLALVGETLRHCTLGGGTALFLEEDKTVPGLE
jgi:hypothetical protein